MNLATRTNAALAALLFSAFASALVGGAPQAGAQGAVNPPLLSSTDMMRNAAAQAAAAPNAPAPGAPVDPAQAAAQQQQQQQQLEHLQQQLQQVQQQQAQQQQQDASPSQAPPAAAPVPAPQPSTGSGLVAPQSPDRPGAFDPSAMGAPTAPVGSLPPGADLNRAGAPPPGANGAGGYPSSLTPPPGVPASAEETMTFDSSPNPSLYKLGPKDTYAVLKTSYGKMTMKLYPSYAPRTVRNFIELAKGEKEFTEVRTGKHVTRPFYDGLIFHRVIRGFLVQTGCPFGNGRGGPGYAIQDEIHRALRHSRAGVVSMASELDKGQPKKDSAGSQFFITLGARPEFDGKFTIFGQIVSGLDVLEKIGNAKTGPTDRPVRRIVLQSIEVVEK